jgi:hypothetical protein
LVLTFFPNRYGSACDHRLFRQPVMNGGHHWLPEYVPVPVLSELWAVRAALSRSKPLICLRQIRLSLWESRKSGVVLQKL